MVGISKIKICRSGLHEFIGTHCRECQKISIAAWRARNPGYTAAWRAANPGYDAAWYAANAEKAAVAGAKYRSENPEKVAACQAAWYAENLGRAKENSAAWRLANPEARRINN